MSVVGASCTTSSSSRALFSLQWRRPPQSRMWNGVLAGVLALAAGALTAAATALRPSFTAAAATAKARQCFEVARAARQAVRDAENDESPEGVRRAHDDLTKRFDEIRTSPEPALPDVSTWRPQT